MVSGLACGAKERQSAPQSASDPKVGTFSRSRSQARRPTGGWTPRRSGPAERAGPRVLPDGQQGGAPGVRGGVLLVEPVEQGERYAAVRLAGEQGRRGPQRG